MPRSQTLPRFAASELERLANAEPDDTSEDDGDGPISEAAAPLFEPAEEGDDADPSQDDAQPSQIELSAIAFEPLALDEELDEVEREPGEPVLLLDSDEEGVGSFRESSVDEVDGPIYPDSRFTPEFAVELDLGNADGLEDLEEGTPKSELAVRDLPAFDEYDDEGSEADEGDEEPPPVVQRHDSPVNRDSM